MQRLLEFIKDVEGTDVSSNIKKVSQIANEIMQECKGKEYLYDLHFHNLATELLMYKIKENRLKKVIIDDLKNFL
jgi:hypothetical protein